MRKDVEQEVKAYIEVENLKKKTHKSSEEAKEATERLNKLLVQNGITLKIYIAAGGKHGT